MYHYYPNFHLLTFVQSLWGGTSLNSGQFFWSKRACWLFISLAILQIFGVAGLHQFLQQRQLEVLLLRMKMLIRLQVKIQKKLEWMRLLIARYGQLAAIICFHFLTLLNISFHDITLIGVKKKLCHNLIPSLRINWKKQN